MESFSCIDTAIWNTIHYCTIHTKRVAICAAKKRVAKQSLAQVPNRRVVFVERRVESLAVSMPRMD